MIEKMPAAENQEEHGGGLGAPYGVKHASPVRFPGLPATDLR